MIAIDSSVAEAPKSRRRLVAKVTRTASKIKIGVYISPESARRLGATALMEARDRSEIIDRLIADHCRRYVIQDRGSRPTDSTSTLSEDRPVTGDA